MYEGFFGLEKRPFSAVPNVDSFVALERTQEALDDLLICLVQSHGIAVVTSFAGLGKTLLCKQVAASAENRFQTVYLSTSAFSTRRALLQAILYEFGIHYEGLSEQEARLKILEAARAIARENRLLLIIVDEAHLLNPRLFEELRTLSDYAPEGEALVRLILSGQFELEEKLADPAMSAIHQRIGCQVTLEPLSLEDSATLVKERLRIAGADQVGEILSEAALEAICRASDGNARCLCQLADHSLLLAFAEEQKPVQRDTVLAALDDLKELPLHWNELSDEQASYTSSSAIKSSVLIEEPTYTDVETDEFEIPEAFAQEAERTFVLHMPEDDQHEAEQESVATIPDDEIIAEDADEIEYSIFEVGAGLDETGSDEAAIAEVEEMPATQEPLSLRVEQESSEPQADIVEEVIVDKYAALDRTKELPNGFTSSIEAVVIEAEPDRDEEFAIEDEVIDGAEILETIECLRQEIGSVVDESKRRLEAHLVEGDGEVLGRLDVVEPVNRDADEVGQSSDDRLVQENVTEADGIEKEPEKFPHRNIEGVIGSSTAEADTDRFSQLFTRLSQRRKRLKRQRAS